MENKVSEEIFLKPNSNSQCDAVAQRDPAILQCTLTSSESVLGVVGVEVVGIGAIRGRESVHLKGHWKEAQHRKEQQK